MFSMADLWSLQTTAAPFTRTVIMILYAQFESAVLLTAMQLMTTRSFTTLAHLRKVRVDTLLVPCKLVGICKIVPVEHPKKVCQHHKGHVPVRSR